MVLLGCSGPGASEAIAHAWFVGFALLGASAVGVTVTAFVRRALGSGLASPGTLLGGLLLLAHPGFWCLPIGGDCGRTRLTLCWAWGAVSTLYVLGACGWALVASRRR